MSRWSSRSDVPRGERYDQRWRALEAAGESIHGEADLVVSLLDRPTASVLDAGCGTGRVAIELARRGFDVVGVDLDSAMLATAAAKAPHLEWREADLVDVVVADASGERRRFDVVVAAGNVLIFLEPGTEEDVVANLARHLRPGGRLVAGFQIRPELLDDARYDASCAAAGLVLEQRWATWDRRPFVEGSSYAVSVHRRAE